MKRTKVVATIGPASSPKDVLKQMVQEGVDVVRLNFSHGAHEVHNEVIKTIREIDVELGTHTAILADLQGPKLRVGEVENNGVDLVAGKQLKITTKEMVGTAEKVFTNYEDFAKDVKPGESVLLDDGKLVLRIASTNGKDEVVCDIIHGGVLSSKKGINLPNTKISLPCLTPKDLVDLEFALEQNVDWIGLSFVRSARDIIELKHIIKDKEKHARVIAKIEKPEAMDEIDDIILETDAVMVARGDLGVEVPMQNVPLIQKSIIQKCISNSKPVIVATQMMETMITNITPTRAEVNDVANAMLDGADAVMLSGETSVGKHPVEVIKAMVKIIDEIERHDHIYYHEEPPAESNEDRFVSDSICYNACRLAKRVEAKAIVTMTFSGYTGFKVSSQRPRARTFVFTGNRKILTLMNLVWGVKAFYYDKMVSTDHTIADIKYILKKQGYLQEDDFVINIASMPISEQGMTNMLKLSKA
ncbi:pyruvate kinase [Sanyastnella coralliicola]|uniref:pyruvate kinase n=1 Tax=Sanyastnella coralliicola TaxID=3069118 RepID=UPI0027BAE30C|nr:pyruvate kinase [Longitalea sp. SCSIO 12813]